MTEICYIDKHNLEELKESGVKKLNIIYFFSHKFFFLLFWAAEKRIIFFNISKKFHLTTQKINFKSKVLIYFMSYIAHQ